MPSRRSVTVEIKGDVDNFNRALLRAATETKGLVNQLDRTQSEMGLLVSSSLALGPALVPLGATAVPAITGLASQLGFAAAAAGAAGLAFYGLGDALGAVNEYQLDPSAKNLEKLAESLRGVGPAGREFVLFLQDLRPQMQELQAIARKGMLPGLESGMDSLMTRMPQIERILATVSRAAGDLAAEAGEALAGPKWEAFFDYLENDARPTLEAFGKTLGNFTLGLANLFVAFAPASDRFSQSFLDMSRAFAEWTANLPDSEGFQSFLSYIHDMGPQVWDTLSSIGEAIMSLLEAAAPVGAVLLPVLEGLAEAFSAIMQTDVGPVLIGMVSALNAVAMFLKLRGLASFGALGSAIGSASKRFVGMESAALASVPAVAAAGKRAKGTSASFLALGGSASTAGRHARRAGDSLHSAGKYADRSRSRFAFLGREMKQTGRGANRVAGGMRRASAQTKVFGTQSRNAARHASQMRSQVTKIGRGAAGVGVLGLAMSDLDDKMGLAHTTTGALIGMMAGPWGAAVGGAAGLLWDLLDSTTAVDAAIDDLNQAFQRGVAGIDAQRKKLEELKRVRDEVKAQAMGNEPGKWSTGRVDLKALDEYRKAKSAVDKYSKALEQNEIALAESKFAEHGLSMSLDGTSRSMREQTLAVLENVAAQRRRADQMLSRFDNETAYAQALRDAKKALKDNGETLNLNTKAGLANREALSGLAHAYNDLAESGASTKQMRNKRKQFIDIATAMTGSRKEARRLAKEMLSIPNQVVTELELLGTDAAASKIAELLANYDLTPKEIVTMMMAADYATPKIHDVLVEMGILDKDEAIPSAWLHDAATSDIVQVRKRLRNLDKSRADPVTFLLDHASGPIGRVMSLVYRLGGMHATPSVSLAGYWRVMGQLGGIMGRVASLGMMAASVALGMRQGGVVDYYASGGMREKHVAQIAPAGAWRVWAEPETGGEAYIPLSPAKRSRSLEIWRETGRRLGALEAKADGGLSMPQKFQSLPQSLDIRMPDGAIDYDRLASALTQINVSMPASASPGDVANEIMFALKRVERGGRYAGAR